MLVCLPVGYLITATIVRGFVNQKINRFKLLLDCIKVEFIRA